MQQLYFGYFNWLFFGSLPGTSSAISRVDNTFGYAMIVNTRTVPVDPILNQMKEVMVKEIKSRTAWPKYDLFTRE